MNKDVSFKNVKGVVLITGEHGVGKTRAAVEAADPKKTLLIDDDEKGRETVRRIQEDGYEFGRYVNFIDRIKNKKPVQIHEEGLKLIDEIPVGKYDNIIWDTWTRFAGTCAAWVQSHNELFRDRWAAMGKIKSGEEYKEARLYEAELISRLHQKAPLVILVSHLKNQYLNNVQTGKQIPATSKAVDSVCNLRLWLKHNPHSTTPIALVLKNIEKNKMVNGRLRTVQVLPMKVTPLDNKNVFEMSIWDAVERYIENPIGNRKPNKDEVPDDFEMSIIHGTLTEDQRLSWLYALKEKKREEEEEQLLLEQQKRSKAVKLFNDGLTNYQQIAKQVNAPITDVIAWIEQSQA